MIFLKKLVILALIIPLYSFSMHKNKKNKLNNTANQKTSTKKLTNKKIQKQFQEIQKQIQTAHKEQKAIEDNQKLMQETHSTLIGDVREIFALARTLEEAIKMMQTFDPENQNLPMRDYTEENSSGN